MDKASRIHITGIVQGVGFRPFVYNLAGKYNLKGFCLNDSEGVTIEVQGNSVDRFIDELKAAPPPLSRIETFSVEDVAASPYTDFSIRESQKKDGKFVLISPDIAICPDCLRELLDPADRRYLYPFINCTNCGPRYSIVKDIPYDRPFTTMAPFKLCADCESEYHNPADRRFHAQPNACAHCGPMLWLAEDHLAKPYEVNYSAIKMVQELLKKGAILAIKGLGGFHLACDAENDKAVKKLRERKRKSLLKGVSSNKPFALMSPDIEKIKSYAHVSRLEQETLEGRIRPIVLLEKKDSRNLSESIAPNNTRYGVMLPYTPMHYLLFNSEAHNFRALVMTSGNLSEEPITISNNEAEERLSGIADYFLQHNRDIYMRVDDSIVRADGKLRILRRARGFTPSPIHIGEEVKDILACGAELKNTFCITKGKNAILSQHIGDLENFEALEFYKETLKNLKNSFRSEPGIIAHDMHPDYLSTKFASEYIEENNIKHEDVFPVQHHHAHIASCMAENGLRQKCIGISFDGTGYGTDGNIWGGEFLIADRLDFKREAHFSYIALPGGDKAVKEPWRVALSYLMHTYNDENSDEVKLFLKRFESKESDIILKMIKGRINSPLTSSAGRLFDAIASIIGLRDRITFEAEAAIELEAIADNSVKESYPYAVENREPSEIDLRPLIMAIINDLKDGISLPTISGRFHNTIADIIKNIARKVRSRDKTNDVVLSGGVFQNNLLLQKTQELLEAEGFKVWTHGQVPSNDGGIALGQAIVAWERFKHKGV
ncbi:MAG: carbamoyltransferase HypF [Deltaproteobacteria bacterium]|nr:carbamoyltransferase HypF [Deltaproteobacteria bacterium]